MTTTQTKHTPGPWNLITYAGSDFGLYHDSGRGSKDFVLVRGEHDDPETQANVRLILAAPDYHEAVERIMRLYNDYAIHGGDRHNEVVEAFVQLHQAHTKAQESA